jgi:hypothetical protein
MIYISIHVRLHLLLFFPCFHFPCCLPSSLDLFFSTIWFIIKSCSNFSFFFYSLFIVRYCNWINCKIIQNILLFLKFNDYKNYKLIILKGLNKIINNSNERLSFKLQQSIYGCRIRLLFLQINWVMAVLAFHRQKISFSHACRININQL